MKLIHNRIKIIIKDNQTINSLLHLDKLLQKELYPIRHIITKENQEYYISLRINPTIIQIYKNEPTELFIHVKTIRANPHLNIPIIYILE